MKNRITDLFSIRYPLIQAGMIWVSGHRLASAVAQAGGLGLIGAGSMYPDVLQEHIRKAKASLAGTEGVFGVNVPLLYPDIDRLMQIIVQEGVRVVFTSAGNPRTWTGFLKDHGVTVVHVVSSAKFAEKAVTAGCDAVVAEGFEAGGHNGREETTTLVLIPSVVDAIGETVPVIAAGGIADGRAMAAAFALGAEGAQVGSRFAVTQESSAHTHFKQRVVEAGEGETLLVMKKLVPVRLLQNTFRSDVLEAEARGASRAELAELLGKRRAKRGMFEGDLEQGELEIGQVSGLIDDIPPAADIVATMMAEFFTTCQHLGTLGS